MGSLQSHRGFRGANWVTRARNHSDRPEKDLRLGVDAASSALCAAEACARAFQPLLHAYFAIVGKCRPQLGRALPQVTAHQRPQLGAELSPYRLMPALLVERPVESRRDVIQL